MTIASVKAGHYRIALPVVLSDSTHGDMGHFELVTVRIRDTDGAEGLGYTYTVGAGGAAILALIERDMAPLLVGAEAEAIEAIWQRLWRHLHYVGRGGLASHGLSAVDIALWDLKARKLGRPLWRLYQISVIKTHLMGPIRPPGRSVARRDAPASGKHRDTLRRTDRPHRRPRSLARSPRCELLVVLEHHGATRA